MPADVATREKPILFSAPMVRAILDGRKTQTRRVVKPQPKTGRSYFGSGPGINFRNLPFEPLTHLWVRETHDITIKNGCGDKHVIYKADSPFDELKKYPWKPSIHMPRWASRITLEITGVRVERVQSISEADILAEGMNRGSWTPGDYKHPIGQIYDDLPGGQWSIAKCNFASTWASINGPDSWAANPWVWCISFRRIPDAR